MVGRPTKLTPETQSRFITGLKLGLTYKLAASYAGVDEATIYRWMQRGRQEDEGIYFEFCKSVKEAEGSCAAQLMARIQRAAEGGTWQASAWILERRFGYRHQVEAHVQTNDEADLDDVEHLISRVADAAAHLKQSEE